MRYALNMCLIGLGILIGVQLYKTIHEAQKEAYAKGFMEGRSRRMVRRDR